MPKVKIKTLEINEIVDQSISHLLEDYREIKTHNGWHQKLGSDKIGNIANAQGLLLLDYFKKEFSNKHLVIETLKKTQFKDTDPKKFGGWGFATNYSKAPSCDCTSWVLLALLNELTPNDKTILDGIEWLKQNTSIKDGNKAWGPIAESEIRTYPTSLALRVLKKARLTNETLFKESLSWLKNTQNPDGGWGENDKIGSTITHTSHAIVTLMECGIETKSPLIIKGCNYITENFNQNDCWLDNENGGLMESVDINDNGDFQRVSYYHFSIAWAITALVKANKLDIKAAMAIDHLIKNNEHGNWKHPYLASKNYYTIYTKHDAMLSLKCFKDCFSNNWNETDKIIVNQNGSKTFSKKKNFLKLAVRNIEKNPIFWACVGVLIILSVALPYFGIIINRDIWIVVILPVIIALSANFLKEYNK